MMIHILVVNNGIYWPDNFWRQFSCVSVTSPVCDDSGFGSQVIGYAFIPYI